MKIEKGEINKNMVKIIPTNRKGLIDLVIGIIIGYLLNWVWETYHLYGEGVVLVNIPVVNIPFGVCDLIEIGAGAAVYFGFNKNIGIGMEIGYAATKVMEIGKTPATSLTVSSVSGVGI